MTVLDHSTPGQRPEGRELWSAVVELKLVYSCEKIKPAPGLVGRFVSDTLWATYPRCTLHWSDLYREWNQHIYRRTSRAPWPESSFWAYLMEMVRRDLVTITWDES